MRAERACRPFVLLFQGRTGSTYLVEALDAHPQVTARYEEMAAMLGKKNARKQLDHARACLTASDGDAATGFKTKLRDVLDPDGFADLIRESGAYVIVLERRNLVKLVVSSFNSERLHERTGDWNAYRREDRPLAPLTIEPEHFVKGLHRHEGYRDELWRYVAKLQRPTLVVYYEDLVADEQAVLDLVFAFLGVEPIVARGRTVKTTSDDLREVVANLDELTARFAGTRYEPMFDEVLVR